jgi:hypothetical protein
MVRKRQAGPAQTLYKCFWRNAALLDFSLAVSKVRRTSKEDGTENDTGRIRTKAKPGSLSEVVKAVKQCTVL